MPSLSSRLRGLGITAPVAAETEVEHKCSLLLCGLPTSVVLASSSFFKWKSRHDLDDMVHEEAMLDLAQVPGSPTSPITMFRYAAPTAPCPTAVPPISIHNTLDLPSCTSACLFIHDASDTEVENSIHCLRQYLGMRRRYGGNGFWIVISSPANAGSSSTSRDLRARFERELWHFPELNPFRVGTGAFGQYVLDMSIEDACRLVGGALGMLASPRVMASKISEPTRLGDMEFRHGFLSGSIAPWGHKDYLRAAYLTLMEPGNRDLGLLDVATKFATNMNHFKQRHSRFQLQPESRTLTVFWLYHVKLGIRIMHMMAMTTTHNYAPKVPLVNLKNVIHYIPELMNEQLPASSYSPDILKSEYAEKFWMLPNLRPLIEPVFNQERKFRDQFTKKQDGDPERLLRFSFAVVQRYLRPGETRRRSWFINLAFAALQRQTMRLRSTQRSVSPYSETQTYFYLQLVHTALSQCVRTGRSTTIQDMSYPLFSGGFGITPSAWEAYYTPQLWDSVKARASFVPPDLKPLPDTIDSDIGPPDPDKVLLGGNQPFRRRGLIPELPNLETLHFHHAILLEDTKPLTSTPTPAEVTSHAHLLQYIHTHLILAPLTSPQDSIHHHHTLLTASSPLPRAHISATLSLTLHHLSPAILSNPDYNPALPPPTPFIPAHTDPETGHHTRHHNCPCHYALALPYAAGPDAVGYPGDPPYEHPPQLAHACRCHAGEALDQDAFAVECVRRWECVERKRKGRLGEGGGWLGGGGGGGEEGFEEWVRGLVTRDGLGLVLCWEEGWRVVSGREGEVGVGRVEVVNEDRDGGEDGIGGGAVVEQKREGGGGEFAGAEDAGDERTLAGTDVEEGGADEGGETGDDWEVLSQDTLC